MRVTRLYHSGPLACGDEVVLDPVASNHLIRVLRTPQGSTINVFNGDGYDYECKTLDSHPKKARISVNKQHANRNESPLHTTLIQGLSRLDRMETSIQKCVELGINRIIPALLDRSNLKLSEDKHQKKIEHWKRVAISACEQSGRSYLPVIHDIQTLDSIAPLLEPSATRLMLLPTADQSLSKLQITSTKIEFIIGPEGGLNDSEVRQLSASGFSGIRFGPRILRTETAGPAILAVLQSRWGDAG